LEKSGVQIPAGNLDISLLHNWGPPSIIFNENQGLFSLGEGGIDQGVRLPLTST